MSTISKEQEIHVSKSGVKFAVASGALIGAGMILPPLAGLGVVVGAVGAIRERSRINDIQIKSFIKVLEDPEKGKEVRKSLGLDQ